MQRVPGLHGSIYRRGAAVACVLLLAGCITQRRPDQIEDLLAQTLKAAETHHEFDLDPEAAVLLDAIAGVDASFPGLEELNQDLERDARLGVERGLLGMNRMMRPQVERSPRARVLLWLPDRILDLMDIVSVGVHFGVGAFADGHVTRGLQVGAGVRSTGGVGLHEHRSLGMKAEAEAGFSLIAVGTHSYAGSLVGTSGVRSAKDNAVGAHRPLSPLYQALRDYWAIGGSATAGIVGATADFHPLQLADFLAGLVGIDFLNDDLAHTRALKFDAIESRMLAELWEIGVSEKLLATYQDAKARGALASGIPQPTPAASVPGELEPAPTGEQGTPAAPDRGE